MPPVPRFRTMGDGGDLTPMVTNDSFSFQIPGSILQSSENLLADDSSDFFLGGASADIDMSAGSPLKLSSHIQTTTIARRVTRSQSCSPQKAQLHQNIQPPQSAKKRGAVDIGMPASSSGISFPASVYHGERLMEVEEMDGMDYTIDAADGMDRIDEMNADDAKALPVLGPIAAELNKPQSSSRRSISLSKPKSKSKAKEKDQEKSASNATTTTNLTATEFESPALASMSAYLPPLSPSASVSMSTSGEHDHSHTKIDGNVNGDKLHPDAFNFGFSPQTTLRIDTAPLREGNLSGMSGSAGMFQHTMGVEEPLQEQGAEASAPTVATDTSHAERKVPASRIERREKRVTSRSKMTNNTAPPATTTTETEVVAVAQAPSQQTPSEPPHAPAPTVAAAPQLHPRPQTNKLIPTKTRPPTETNPSTSRVSKTTASNPFEALKKRVVTNPDTLRGVEVASVSAPATITTSVETEAKKVLVTSAGPRPRGGDVDVDVVKLDGAAAASIPATTTTVMRAQPESEPAVSNTHLKTRRIPTTSTGEMQPTSGLVDHEAEATTTTAVSRMPLPPSPTPAGLLTVTTAGAKLSAFGALKAGSRLGSKTIRKDKTSARGGDIDNAPTDNRASGNTKKRPSSEAEVVFGAGSRAMPGAYEMATDGGDGGNGASATDNTQAAPPRKRARRDSIMLGKGAATGSSSSMLRRGSLLPCTSVTTTTTAAPPVMAVPTVIEEPEPAVDPASAPSLEAMDVEIEATPDPVVRDVGRSAPDAAVPPSTGEQTADVEAEIAVSSVPPPAPAPASGFATGTGTVPPADAARDLKALRKRKREEEAEAQRNRDEARRKARREQQKVLRKSVAVVAAAAAAAVVAIVATDTEQGEDWHEEEEGEDEGANGSEQGAGSGGEEGEEEDLLSAPNFGAIKAPDASKNKVESKGKAKAKSDEVKNDSKKRARTTSTTTAAAKATASRSTTVSSSKASTARTAQVQAQAKASRKVATNSRVNRSKIGPPASSSAVAGPSTLSSSELQFHNDTRTRSHSRAGRNAASAEVQEGPGLGLARQAASGASLATSSSSSSFSKSRPQFQVPLPATLHGEFAARADVRREARRREKERDPAESDGTTNAKPATRSTSRTSSRNSNSSTAKKDKPPIPDFAAMHATQAALLARAKASLPPLTKPHGPALTTEARMKERSVFDAHVKEKEAEEERKREEERRRREEEEELEVKEMRRHAVPKAHEVPEWYRDMPKKTKTVAGSGDQPSSSTS